MSGSHCVGPEPIINLPFRHMFCYLPVEYTIICNMSVFLSKSLRLIQKSFEVAFGLLNTSSSLPKAERVISRSVLHLHWFKTLLYPRRDIPSPCALQRVGT